MAIRHAAIVTVACAGLFLFGRADLLLPSLGAILISLATTLFGLGGAFDARISII